jgi:DNA-binding MarR family transcriptional regulator
LADPSSSQLRRIESQVEALFRQVNLTTRSCARAARLTVPQLHTLIALGDTPRPTPAVVALLVGLSRPSMTNVLDGLERKGLIERRHTRPDRRQVELVLTARGEALVGSLQRPVRTTLEGGLRSLDADRLAQVEEGLALLQRALDQAGQNP